MVEEIQPTILKASPYIRWLWRGKWIFLSPGLTVITTQTFADALLYTTLPRRVGRCFDYFFYLFMCPSQLKVSNRIKFVDIFLRIGRQQATSIAIFTVLAQWRASSCNHLVIQKSFLAALRLLKLRLYYYKFAKTLCCMLKIFKTNSYLEIRFSESKNYFFSS